MPLYVHRTHIGGGFCPNVEKSLNNPARLVVNKWRTFAASRLSPYFYLVPESFSRPNNFHYTKVISQWSQGVYQNLKIVSNQTFCLSKWEMGVFQRLSMYLVPCWSSLWRPASTPYLCETPISHCITTLWTFVYISDQYLTLLSFREVREDLLLLLFICRGEHEFYFNCSSNYF